MSDHELSDAEACELTLRGTPLGAATGRSQASAPLSSVPPAAELIRSVRSQGCAPVQPAASPAGGPGARSRTSLGGALPICSSREDHQQSNPCVSVRAQANRRMLYRMQDGLRSIQRDRVARCGRVRIGSNVAILIGASGRAHYGGLLRCGSVWACPVCGSAIRAGRAEEVRRAVERHGSQRALLLSLTVRHGLGHALRCVRRGVAKAWTRMIRGAPWKRFAKRVGLVGLIRALEVTHGPENGWHPHIHALVLTGRTLDDAELRDASMWLSERWQECVQRALGDEHRPDYAHGCDLRPCHSADYIAKLGLELTAPGRSKRAKGQNRTPMEIAYDFATEGRGRDSALWTDFCESMYGAKMLTWSKDLRKRLGMPAELSDEELSEEAETHEILALIAGRDWDRLRDTPGVRTALLEAAERGGLRGLIALASRLGSDLLARASPAA